MRMSSQYNDDDVFSVPGMYFWQWKECSTIAKGVNPGVPSGNGVTYVLFRPINITAIGKNYKMSIIVTTSSSTFCQGWCVLGCNDGDEVMHKWTASTTGIGNREPPSWNLTNFNYKWLFFSWSLVSYGLNTGSYSDIGFKFTAI